MDAKCYVVLRRFDAFLNLHVVTSLFYSSEGGWVVCNPSWLSNDEATALYTLRSG